MALGFKMESNELEKSADFADAILEKLLSMEMDSCEKDSCEKDRKVVKEIRDNMKLLCRKLDSLAKKSK